jgi:exodeoxyribonuclease VII small subunit
VAKEAKEAKVPDKYGDVVQRLEEVVRRLEGGELSLEDSLKDFEEGIKLVRRGESLLNEAERRIEQLLAEGGGSQTEPVNGAAAAGQPVPQVAAEREDVPF